MSGPDLPADSNVSAETVSDGMRVQRSGGVRAVLDADAHLHVWEPNRSGDRIDFDLTDQLAALVDLGIGAPPAPEPHWTDSEGTTVIVSLDVGARGRLLVDGHDASPEAATALAAAGFIQLLQRIVEDGGGDRRSDDHRGDADAGT